jgi:hypothetical protein
MRNHPWALLDVICSNGTVNLLAMESGKTTTVWTAAIDRGDYAAIATPVTSAHVVNAWLRAIRNFDAVSWLGRRENTLAT